MAKSKITTKDLNQCVKDNYIRYGKEVDLLRVVPHMYDGLKPVYKKLILSMLTFPKDKFIETVTVIGHCKSYYYVHGDASLGGVVDRLVQCGIFIGKGTFGYSTLLTDIGAAQPRYTKVMLNPKYRNMIDNLLPFVPKFQNDIDVMEPEYIPTPIPLGCLAGSLGLGVGLVQRMPPLEPKSIVEAMRTDDYSKIESAYGFKLSLEDKKEFWTDSAFSFTYEFQWKKIPGGYNIDGNGDWVKPNLPPMYDKADLEHDRPLYEIVDNFGKTRKDIDIITMDPFITDKVIDKACHVKIGNILWVVNPNKNRAELTTGRDLLKNCFDNYSRLYTMWKNSELHKLNIELEAFVNFKEIANLIINTDKSKTVIMNELKLSCIEVVEHVAKMPVGTLRNYDPKKKVKSLKDKIDEVKAYSVDDILNTI